MKLTDISQVSADVLNTKLETQTGWKLQLENLSVKKASVMLENVNSKLDAIRTSSQVHTSEKDPRFTTMLMTQQILESYLEEAKKEGKNLPPWLKGEKKDDEEGTDDKKEKTKDSAKKAMQGEGKMPPQFAKNANKNKGKKVGDAEVEEELEEERVPNVAQNKSKKIRHPDDVDVLTKAARAGDKFIGKLTGKGAPASDKYADIASKRGAAAPAADKYARIAARRGSSKNESKFATESKLVDLYIRKLITEDQVTQAQSVMAAKDMVDSIQDMLEDLSKMLNEQLPPLVDSVRANIGDEQASGFQQAASNSLNTLLQAAQGAREEINNAVLSLTGEGPSQMAMPDQMAPNDASGLGGDDAGLGLGDEGDDAFGASDAAAGGDMPMGREKRI